MAQKVNPTSYRLGVGEFWKIKDLGSLNNYKYLINCNLLYYLQSRLFASRGIIQNFDLKTYDNCLYVTLFISPSSSYLIKLRRRWFYLKVITKHVFKKVPKRCLFIDKDYKGLNLDFFYKYTNSKRTYKLSWLRHERYQKYHSALKLLPRLANLRKSLIFKREKLLVEEFLTLFYKKRVMVQIKNIYKDFNLDNLGVCRSIYLYQVNNLVSETLDLVSSDKRYFRFKTSYLFSLLNILNSAILVQSPKIICDCVLRFVFQNRRHKYNLLLIQNLLDILMSAYPHKIVNDIRIQISGKMHNKHRSKLFNTRYFWYYPINSFSISIKYYQRYVVVKAGVLSIKVWFMFSGRIYNIRKS